MPLQVDYGMAQLNFILQCCRVSFMFVSPLGLAPKTIFFAACDMKPVSVSSSLAMAPAQPLVPTRTIVTNSSNKPTNSIFGKLPLSQTRSSPSTLIQPLNPLPPSTHRAHATNISPFQTSPTLLSVHPHILTPDQPRALTGVKRRLGMGRIGTGYTNKKFKTPEM